MAATEMQSASERFALFFVRRRHWFALAIGAITIFFAWQMRHLEIYSQFLDLLPRHHAYIHTYEQYREVYGNANTVVIAVVAREGDLYQPEVLRAVSRATALLDTSLVAPEVNAKPASHYVRPSGFVARTVHALVAEIDGAFRSQEPRAGETGVDHNLVASLTHRTARDQRVDPEGTLHSPALLAGAIPEAQAELDDLRARVRRNPTVFGVLVSPDEKAALVRASFIETRLDYAALFKHLQHLKHTLEAEHPVAVYVSGQPVLFGWTYAFASEILLVFALTLGISVLLLWAYFRRAFGVFLPLSGALVNVVWGLGFAAMMGYALDPLVLVVPMLITARAISHSVQFVERFYEEYEELGDKEEACVRSMAELLLPGTMAILTDCVGLLTISLATIPLVHKLGLLCAFWAASIAVTEMLLNRLLILYLPPPRERAHYVPPTMTRLLDAAARLVQSRTGAAAVVAGFAVAAALGLALASGVEVGENRPGTPLLYPDSEYNVAAREIGSRFGGTDDLLIVAHSDVAGRVYTPDSLALIEALQTVLEADPAAGGSVSLVDLLQQTNRTFHHKDPRWAMRMQTPVEVLGFQFLIESSVPAPGVLDPYRAIDQRSLAVRVFYRDHQAATVSGAVERLSRFVESERLDGTLAVRLRAAEPGALRRALGWLAPILPPVAPRLEVSVPAVDAGMPTRRMLTTSGPIRERAEAGGRIVERWEEGPGGAVAEVRHAGGFAPYELWVSEGGGEPEWRWSRTWLRDGVELRHAAGSIGVLAAANEEVGASHRLGLAVAFAATFLIIVMSYRSLLVGLLLLASLGVAALAALATQTLAGIAINVNTLPVQAIGIGIGVDYAIYIVDRILAERRRGLSRADAVARAIRTTGLAIGFTASTLLVGIVFWIPVSSLRFSAEMSLLLCILMAVNALGAILLVPALVRLLPQRLARRF